jgi:hypothetical protein
MLEIFKTPSVIGDVFPDRIINDAVNGTVYARVMLELQPKARIQRNMHDAALEKHRLPSFLGSCDR